MDNEDAPARRLTGKVAKLPLEIRRIINEMLDEAETYKSIVARLNDLGYPGFFEQNIQRWKDHGYQRWVQFHEKLEIAKQQMEEARELAKDPQNAASLAEANMLRLQMDTAHRWDDVSQWDTETTVKNGKYYNQLSRSTIQQQAENTRRERFRLEAELKRRKQEISEDAKQKIRDLTNPLSQAERTAILDAIDDILGIRIDPDEPPSQSFSPTPSNTVENPTTSEAENEKNTVEKNEPPTDEQPGTALSIPSPGGEGQGEGGIPVSSVSSAKSVVAPSAPVSDPASVRSVVESSETPNVKNTVENSNDSKAENENNTVENFPPQTSANPKPETSNPEPVLRRSPADKIYRDPFPISPLAPTPPARKQPRNHVPLLDIHGQLIQWIPRDQEPTFENRIGWENRRGLSTCWMNPTHLVPEPPVHHNVPIVSREGIILAWVPHNIEPFEKAEPIRSRFNLQRKIGWWEQAPEKSEPDPRAGCLVG